MSRRWAHVFFYFAALLFAFAWLLIGTADPPARDKAGFLGLEFAPLTAAAQARAPYLTDGGALVTKVVDGSPAEASGFVSGTIVTEIDGRVISSASDAADLLAAKRPGVRVVLTVYDPTNQRAHTRNIAVILAASAPQSERVYTVEPPRVLAREWDFAPSMAAHAAWSRGIARGAVVPLQLQVFARGRCSAVAPEDWRIVDSSKDGSSFALVSDQQRARAIFAVAPVGRDAEPEAVVGRLVAKFARVTPEMSASQNASFGFRVIDFGSAAGYSGFALYRVFLGGRNGRGGPIVSVRAVAVPASDVAELAPLAGAVALSVRCSNGVSVQPRPFDETLSPWSVSLRCLKGSCEESDFAGAYNEAMHTGYVHSPDGENFLIDPRKDIWATGPGGPGTYRQVNGTLEKLEPGRTN